MPETPSSKEAHRGRCLCGEVKYTVHGPPIRVTICYCTFCQRATGSTYLFEPIWPADALTIVEGKPKTYSAISEGSGKEIIISFCDRCLATDLSRSTTFAGRSNVHLFSTFISESY